MKLNKQILRQLISEIITERKNNSYLLTESMDVFDQIYPVITDPAGPAQWCFITAHNPPVKAANVGSGYKWNNDKKQQELIRDLNSLGYKFLDGSGVYGGAPEESLMVIGNTPQINGSFKINMIKLGKKYLQDAIVYAEKYMGASIDYEAGEEPVHVDTGEPLSQQAGESTPSGPRFFWNMQMIMLEPNKSLNPTPLHKFHIDKQSNLFLTDSSVQSKDNFYTIMKGMKSYIPFYEKEREEFVANPYPAEE